jgi:hypothetical protein
MVPHGSGADAHVEQYRTETRRPAGRLARGSALIGSVVALLLVLMPLGQAATVHANTTFSAPYNGKGITSTLLQTLGCGVKGTIPTHPKFTTSTGAAVLVVKTKAKSCPAALGYNWVIAGGGVGYFSKPFHGLSGAHAVVATWSVSWTSVITAGLGPRSTGAAHATSFLVATLYLLDETNLTYLLPSNSWGWFSSTTNGTVSVSSSATVSMFLNQTLVASHSYMITASIDATSYCQASSQGPSVATGSLSLSGSGNSTKLTSLTLS